MQLTTSRSARFLPVVFAFVFFCSFSASAQGGETDSDHDGLSDVLESKLLEQFRPNFLVSTDDCDRQPSELAAASELKYTERNGRIYGQVTPGGSEGSVEVRYFHLWSKDCGRSSHANDVEHVTALVQRSGESWRAKYWYAAAHESTWCDRSRFSLATKLNAVDRGPTIWISSGKHASFFTQDQCNGGCGGDVCKKVRPLEPLAIANLGEKDQPSAEAPWLSSPSLALTAKLRIEFTDEVIAQLEKDPEREFVIVSNSPRGAQRTIAVSSTTLGALETGQGHTARALGTANRKTRNAISRSYRAVKGLGKDKPPAQP